MRHQSLTGGHRREKRLLWLAGLLGVLLIGVLVNGVLHGGGTSPGGTSPVAVAAQRTAAMPGAHVALDVSYHVEGESESIDGRGGGAYNARTGHSRTYLALPVSAETVTIHSVGDAHAVYLRGANLDAALPTGKKWTRIELLLGHFTVTAFSTNGGVQSAIEALQAVEDAERVGEETIRGRQTTRYKGTFEFSHEAETLSEGGNDALAQRVERLAEEFPDPIPLEAWIDERGLARKIRIVEPLPEATGGRVLTMDLSMELFDFGSEPKIELPSPSTVLDYSPVARAELQLLNGEANSHLIAATPPPLQESEFRRRGLAICAGIRAELGSISGAASEALRRISPGVDPSQLSPLESLATARQWSAHVIEPIAHLEKRILKPLAALGPPSDAAAAYRDLLERFAIDAEAREAQARALQAGAFNIYTKVEKEFFTDDVPEEQALLRRVGLGRCLKGTGDRPRANTA